MYSHSRYTEFCCQPDYVVDRFYQRRRGEIPDMPAYLMRDKQRGWGISTFFSEILGYVKNISFEFFYRFLQNPHRPGFRFRLVDNAKVL